MSRSPVRPAPWRHPRRWAIAVAALVLLATPLAPVQRGLAQPAGALPTPAMIDSENAAIARSDWAAALGWARAVADREPRDANALLDLAKAWHNEGWLPPPRELRPGSRPLSLRRGEIDRLAVALADSAARVARTDDERAEAIFIAGLGFEVLGLPIEALRRFEQVVAIKPGNPIALRHRERVLLLQRHPLALPLLPRAGEARAAPVDSGATR